MGKLAMVFLALASFCASVLIIERWHIQQDIGGWKTRAQVSSEPNDMLEYMSQVKSGMEDWRMTQGYAAIIFTSPDNDMALIYKTVGRHVDQARILTTMNRATPEYQTGLDNLRGSIRELDLHAFYFWSVHDGFLLWVLLIVLGLVGIVLAAVAFG